MAKFFLWIEQRINKMSQDKFSTHGSNRKSLLWQLVTLITLFVLAFSGSLQIALAGPIEWPPPPDDPPSVDDPDFEPYPHGFDWAVPSRFGRDDNYDDMVDYHWNSGDMQYDQSWIYPESWSIIFDGCRTEADAEAGASTTNTYKWMLNGETIEGNLCRFTYGKNSPNAGNLGFPDQGNYSVDLIVTYGEGITSPTGQNPESFHQDVVVRDILIVSLGDSFASGEGVPDIPQRYHIEWWWPVKDADAVWQDQRCHRSANAGPAQAALAIERMDPKTSVTFLSYACAGAMIGTQIYDPYDIDKIPELPWYLDPNRPRGSGVLGPYRGADVPREFPYDWAMYIPSQVSQLQQGLLPPTGQSRRQVDALIVSAGGNDMYFADILKACLGSDNCSGDTDMIQESPFELTLWSPREIINRALGIYPGREENTVPYHYGVLATELSQFNPAPPAHVYVTQYPDLASSGKSENDGYCKMLEDIVWPFEISPAEAKFGTEEGLRNLNEQLHFAVQAHTHEGWRYVDGLATYLNGSPGLFYGHGYCATENWITRAEESELRQGPLGKRHETSGTAHPNYSGHQAYKQRLLHYMVPDLFPQPPANPPVISAPVYAIGSLVDVPGVNGWYVGSCQDGACYPRAVMQVVGTAQAGVVGAGVTIGGVNACTVSGVTCRSDGGLSGDKKQYVWNIEISAEGIYDFQFNLRDKAGAVATGGAAIKVDLHDPALAAPGPFTIAEGGTMVLGASVTSNESSPVSFTWDLDNDDVFETHEQRPEFSAASLDGPTSQIIKVKATDQAGRSATSEAEIHILNVSPTAEITGVMESNLEGTALNLSSAVTDPGAADTFSYDWSVTTDGSLIASGSEADLSFTPRDNGAYNVSLKVTDDDGGETTVIRTINVLNEPPIPGILGVPDSVYEGTTINLTSSVSDPGLDDTFTYAWTVKKNGVDYASGSSTNFSFTPDDNGSYVVSLNVSDNDGGEGSTSQTITVVNAAPVLSNISVTPGNINEGGAVTVSGNISDPGSADSFVLTVTWGDGSAASTTSLPSGSTSFSLTHTYTDDNPTGTPSDTNNISLSLTDDDGGIGNGSASVVVNNLAPSLTIISPADGTLYAINTSVSLSGEFSDGGTLDTFSCSVEWGDGVTVSGTLAAGKCSANHAYSAAGVYNVKMTVSDDDTGSDVKTVMVVVYDPSAGFVTGGGWSLQARRELDRQSHLRLCLQVPERYYNPNWEHSFPIPGGRFRIHLNCI
jgi:PKD repeat protein